MSVILLTRNSEHTLKACLGSIQKEKPGEIIAIDAHSTDNTLSILRDNGVRIFADNYFSLGSSRQLGVQSATRDFVMFVDSDVQLKANCIGRLLAEMQVFGWIGIHAKLLSAENVSYWQRCQDEAYLESYSSVGPRSQIGTIAALFKRDILIKYPFDSFFKESSEDVEICRRLTSANQPFGVSSAIAYHYHRRTFRDFVKQRFRNGIGTTRLSLKYHEKIILIEPLVTAISLIVRNIVSKRFTRTPYFVVSGIAEFTGVLYGLLKIRREDLVTGSKSAVEG